MIKKIISYVEAGYIIPGGFVFQTEPAQVGTRQEDVGIFNVC
jgi:hypothetical protein